MGYDQGMNERSSNAIVRAAKDFVATLKTSYLLMLVTGLFAADVVIPDALPFADELLLFALTLLVARWKSRGRQLAHPPEPPADELAPRASDEE